MLFAAPPPQPVSFSKQVAPVLALHCNSCHGEAGGLSTRSYDELMRGGNLGKVIIPRDPGRSLILAFLDGRRGEQQRMPKEGHPLPAETMDTIRRWIAEGATDDQLPLPPYRLTLPAVVMSKDRITRVFCRVNTKAYLTITARDPRTGIALWSEVGSLKLPKEKMDLGQPGELITWDLRAGPGWPSAVTLELVVLYAASDPGGTEFYSKQVER